MDPLPPAGPGPAIRSALAGVPAVAQLLPEYVAGLARDVGLMAAHLAAGRRADLRCLAHQVRGSGGTYGFADVSRLATAVESAADTGATTARLTADLAALADHVRQIERAEPADEAPPTGG